MAKKFEMKNRSVAAAKDASHNSRKRRDTYDSDSSSADFDVKSPLKRHGCTDIICTLLFFTCVTLLGACSVLAFMNGDPANLVLPHDSAGNICGRTAGVEQRPYLLFFDLTQCVSLSSLLGGCATRQVCVAQCPSRNAFAVSGTGIGSSAAMRAELAKYCDPLNSTACPSYVVKSKPLFGRCVPELIADATAEGAALVVDMALEDGGTAAGNGTAAPQTIQTLSSNGTLVDLTSGQLNEGIKYLKRLLNLKETFQLALEDFANSYNFILIAFGLGALVSLVWIFLLRYIIKPLIYFSIVAVLGLLAFAAFFSVREYLEIRQRDSKSNSTESSTISAFQMNRALDLDYMRGLKETWLALAIVFGLVLLVLLLIVVFLFRRIQLAAAIIKEVSKATIDLPASFIWPVVPLLLGLGVIAYCVAVSVYLAASGFPLFKVVQVREQNSSNSSWASWSAGSDQKYAMDEVASDEKYKVGDYCVPDEFSEASDNDPSLHWLGCVYFRYGFDPKLQVDLKSPIAVAYYKKIVEIINEYQYVPQLYVLFMLFWLVAFVVGLNQMTMAGAFGAWYWTRYENTETSRKNKLPFFTLIGSFGRAIFFHIGTLAFGSLLIALVKIARLILEFLSRKLKPRADENKLAKYVVCCLHCCFWCLEKFIKYLSRNAFIVTAVYSLNFCRAAAKAFKLVTTNVVRVAVVDRVSNFILFLSNVAITSGVAVLAFYFFTRRLPLEAVTSFAPELHFYVVPLVLVVLGVYAITRLFFDVFAMGIDTMLMCVLIDLDVNDGSREQPYFMSKSLKQTLKVSNRKF